MPRITVKPCPVILPLHKMSPMAASAIKYIVIHCSATKATQKVDAAVIHAMHIARKFAGIGYHYVISRDGTVQKGRPDNFAGAHVNGHNSHSLGICMVGGIDANGKAENNYTDAQFFALRLLLLDLSVTYPKLNITSPNARVVLGHRDLSPDKNGDGIISKNEWLKDCPCFDVRTWVEENLS